LRRPLLALCDISFGSGLVGINQNHRRNPFVRLWIDNWDNSTWVGLGVFPFFASVVTFRLLTCFGERSMARWRDEEVVWNSIRGIWDLIEWWCQTIDTRTCTILIKRHWYWYLISAHSIWFHSYSGNFKGGNGIY